MSAFADQVRRLLSRGEVDDVERGRAHVEAGLTAEEERAARRRALGAADERHPDLRAATRRRSKLLRK